MIFFDFGSDLFTGTSQAFDGDTGDNRVQFLILAKLEGRVIFLDRFIDLAQDKSSVAAVFCIELHHCMSGRSGSGEKVEDEIVGVTCLNN